MKNIIGTDADKLASLQIDTLQKVRGGHITLEQWGRFNDISTDDREERFGDWKKSKKEKVSIPISEADTEKILKNNSQFMTKVFTAWYSEEKAKMVKQSVEIISPKNIDWETKKDGRDDEDKFGEYTMNPDTVGIDWENIPYEKIEIFDFPEFIGKPIFQLGKYLTKNYSDRYHIPGIEYWKFIYENEDKVHKELNDGNYYYFFGSILCGWGGFWYVPFAGWNTNLQWYHDAEGDLVHDADLLRDDWDSNNRVLLLKK